MPKTFHDLHAQLIREASSNEDGDSDATVLEGIIVDVINTGTTARKDSKVADGTVAGAVVVGKEVVSRLRAKGWSCTSASLAPHGTVSKNWQIAYGDTAANTTPKTDIIVDGKQVSIKKGPGQLMSGTLKETKATFWAAIGDAALKGDGDILTNKTTVAIEKCIVKMQRKLPPKITIDGKVIDNPLADQSMAKFKGKGTVTDLQKKGTDHVFNYIDDLQLELTELFDKAFERNPDLKVAFVKEAMTGERKFVPGSKAIAKYLLSTSKTGTEAVTHTITSQFIKSVASKCEVACRFKTGSIKNKMAKPGARVYDTSLSINVDTSETALPIVKRLESLQKQSKNVYNTLKTLEDKLKKTTLTPIEIDRMYRYQQLLGLKAQDARNFIYPQNREDRLDPLTIKKVIELLGKTSPRLAKWVESGGAGNLPESFAPTSLNTLTESMVELYEQELITEQELVEGMIDWLGAIKNTLTNNATVAMAFGLRRTENMGSDLKNIADKFGIEVDVVVGKNPIDWHSISKGFA